MAVPAGTMQTFQQIGRREDLSKLIFDISPTEKPFTSAVKKVKATQSKHEWQTDALAAASPTASAMIEGDDASANTADPTVRLNNQLQTLRKVVSVSGRAREIDTAGRAEVYAKDCDQVAHGVREWAIANGENPQMRIALCGYEGEHQMPESWECLKWKARKGYGGQRQSGENDNSERERIWFSPYCLRPSDDLFGSLGEEG